VTGEKGSTGGEPGWPRLIAYGLPALPLALLTLPFYVIVPSFYANAGVPIALVGQILLAIRLLDAFTDPLAGYLNDRTSTRFGRRRVWFAAGVPLTALAAWMVFDPPEQISGQHLLVWGTALSIGWTIALVPFNAWGAELSPSYDGRNRVVLVREGFTFVGTLAALILNYVLSVGLDPLPGAARTLETFGLIVLIGVPLTAFIAVLIVPEPSDRSVRQVGFAEGFGFMRNNRPFRRLVFAFLINGLANGLPATLFVMFVSDRLQLPDKAGLFLIIYFVSGLIGMPFWMQVAKLKGKHRSWCGAMLVACAAFILAPLLPPGAEAGFLAICVVTGFAVGADLVLPASLQADVIDVDTAASGEQRSGLYLAIWGLATKLALALAVGIAFPVLSRMGYDPGAEQRSEMGLLTLALLYAALPVFLKLIAIAAMWRFPLDAERQAELRAAIDRRRAAVQ
jgi:glycoside/pentoside/hexuronide:cation symporter, GPH family